MRVSVWIRRLFAWPVLGELEAIQRMQKETNMRLSELIAQLGTVNESLDKAKTEIVNKIDELEAALVDVEIPADAEAALNDLKLKAQALDDIVPDVTPG